MEAQTNMENQKGLDELKEAHRKFIVQYEKTMKHLEERKALTEMLLKVAESQLTQTL